MTPDSDDEPYESDEIQKKFYAVVQYGDVLFEDDGCILLCGESPEEIKNFFLWVLSIPSGLWSVDSPYRAFEIGGMLNDPQGWFRTAMREQVEKETVRFQNFTISYMQASPEEEISIAEIESAVSRGAEAWNQEKEKDDYQKYLRLKERFEGR